MERTPWTYLSEEYVDDQLPKEQNSVVNKVGRDPPRHTRFLGRRRRRHGKEVLVHAACEPTTSLSFYHNVFRMSWLVRELAAA